jgi:hypothetical protein
MLAIISHDIDHISVSEHLFKDAIVPKYLVRNGIELASAKISIQEFSNRTLDLFKNKWQNIEELIDFNKQHGVPSSFFIGIQNGLGLSYSQAVASAWIKNILEANCEISLHGIAFENFEQINMEYKLFQSISGLSNFGTRMHYVRKNEHTLANMALSGYSFDSTEHAFKNPYKIGNMWEFPFQIMDGWVIEKGKRWQTQTLDQAKENTKRILDEVYKQNLSYVGIDFHDRYFTKSFKTWIDWYVWIVEYLKLNGIGFVDFRGAIANLNLIKQ